MEEVEPHVPELRSWLAARFRVAGDLDDIIQEVYIRVIRARERGGVRSVRAFLFLAARNATLDLFRRRSTNVVNYVDNLAALLVVEDKPDAAETAACNHELEMLADAMRALPDRCRQVFTLRKIYGISQKEIAVQLGISEHTVEVQVCNGARRCAAFMRAKGMTRP